MSLRSPERGLKSTEFVAKNHFLLVAPFAGAWIEIEYFDELGCRDFVAPFAGAWIEIYYFNMYGSTVQSLRSPERGLKSCAKAMPAPAPPRRSVRRSVD